MVSDKNSHQTSPQDTCPTTYQVEDDERQCYPEQEGAIYKNNDRVLQQMTAVHTGSGKFALEDPTNMRVKEPFKRAVGVALLVGLRVVLDMHCCPLNRRCLNS